MPSVDNTLFIRHNYISKLALIAASLLCSLFLTGFGPPRLVDSDFAPSIRLNTGQLREMAEAGQVPPISAKAAMVYNVSDGQVIFQLNETQSLPHASLTKLMTALLILEKGSADATFFDAVVTVQPSDLVGGATMGLQAGETLTVGQLFYGLLIPSGNDAAMTLARYHAGSVDVFVQFMNQRAASLGLAQTQFQNPHGFDADNHFSSVQNIVVLTQQLLNYPFFREVVATKSINVAGHQLTNTNQLLGEFNGAIGVKTGTTPAAGQCLVSAIERNGQLVLIVQLGSQDRYEDARNLYASYEKNYRWIEEDANRLTALDRVYAPDGTLWYLQAQGDPPQIVQQRWGTEPLRKFRRLNLPITDKPWRTGMGAGTLEWWLADSLIATQPLVLE